MVITKSSRTHSIACTQVSGRRSSADSIADLDSRFQRSRRLRGCHREPSASEVLLKSHSDHPAAFLAVVTVFAMLAIGPSRCLARSAEIFHDALCITDTYSYQTLMSNHCDGSDVWGESLNAQASDDFDLSDDALITRITADFVTYFGSCPDTVCFGIYAAGSDCLALNDAFVSWTFSGSDGIVCEEFNDEVFGGRGVRIALLLRNPLGLPAGQWFLRVQPSTPRDWSYQVAAYYPNCVEHQGCGANRRDGSENDFCCVAEGSVYGYVDWHPSPVFEEETLAMRVEGIRAGDCSGGESLTAVCRGREDRHKIVAKVSGGAPGAAINVLLDPPDARVAGVTLDDNGKGKARYRRVSAGEHHLFACDAEATVTCGP